MDEDYEVEAVGSGSDALERLPAVQPDLVIADVHMPGADGYEVCQRAKAMRAGLPVLLLVGTFEPSTRHAPPLSVRMAISRSRSIRKSCCAK